MLLQTLYLPIPESISETERIEFAITLLIVILIPFLMILTCKIVGFVKDKEHTRQREKANTVIIIVDVKVRKKKKRDIITILKTDIIEILMGRDL